MDFNSNIFHIHTIMKTIELALQNVTGFLMSITRNTVDGWYEIEVGIPDKWVFDENTEIRCEVLGEGNGGKLVKISPKKTDVSLDDLILFVEIIIETNHKIAEKEKQFTDRMEEMKKVLEKEASEYYKELDELRENSFKKSNDNFVQNLHSTDELPKQRKPRQPKEKSTVDTSLDIEK